MVYNSLLLSEGGGIMNMRQQAEQKKNTVNILIGLGGTGIDTIRSIKTQVYERIKSDESEYKSYSRIRFLGIDRNEKSRDVLQSNGTTKYVALGEDEFFCIRTDVHKLLQNYRLLENRAELGWLNYEYIDSPLFQYVQATGIRQIGRLRMMERSAEFISKIEHEINFAKRGLINPVVNVHIFSGLSGETGSGCFLDVCYMIRDIAERINGVTILGYFFLPDVNLSIVPPEVPDVRAYIVKNGYSAMQELDYCMSLPENGGCFKQEYQGEKVISWNCPPVDLCHLLTSKDSKGNEYSDGYSCAIDTATEFLMTFLSESEFEIDLLSEYISYARSMIRLKNEMKRYGTQMAYCSLGAKCMSVPSKEINTYLVSELFDKFALIQRNVPSREDVERFAISSLARDAQSTNTIYDSLYREIREGAAGEYAQYQDDWKYVRTYGDTEMIEHYINQTAAQMNKAESNAKSMILVENSDSLLARIQVQLVDVLRDIDRGPVFAYRMISASECHNLLNIIDGLIQENRSRMEQEGAQTDLRRHDYEDSKYNFMMRIKKSIFVKDKQLFEDYEYYLLTLEQHKLNMFIYKQLDFVLITLRYQVVEITASYYAKLKRVMENLLNTFAVNRYVFESGKYEKKNDIPLVRVPEIKDALDTEVMKVNVSGAFKSFVDLFIQKREEWIFEDEKKISNMVSEYFMNTVFSHFSAMTITSFLRVRADSLCGGHVTDVQLMDIIYEHILNLRQRTIPMLNFNKSLYSNDRYGEWSCFSYPTNAFFFKTAAEKIRDISVLNICGTIDRISYVNAICGFPLAAYEFCSDYEKVYYSSKEPGRHYYEGKPLKDVHFSDWNRLPSITPQSVVDIDHAPEDLARLIKEANNLYERALSLGVLDNEGYFYEADKSHLVYLNTVCDACETAISGVRSEQDAYVLQQKIESLKGLLRIPMIRISKLFTSDGCRITKELIHNIQKDYFFSSPELHETVQAKVELVEKLIIRANTLITVAEEKIQFRVGYNSDLYGFCEALLTGVITIDGRIIAYNRVIDGNKKAIILNKRGEEYPFSNIPLYQGFLSYQKLEIDVKNEIKKLVCDRLAVDAPEIYSVGNKLKTYFSEERFDAFGQLATLYKECSEIIAFILDIKRVMNDFFHERGI